MWNDRPGGTYPERPGLPLEKSFDYSFREVRTPFVSASQSARVSSEGWVQREMYCPACGQASLDRFPNNAPVADFACAACDETFELKSTKGRFGRKIVDGAYRTMIERLKGDAVPNLMLMSYDAVRRDVTDLIVVPSQFITPAIIERRPPLAPTARRAGWEGCNILWTEIPAIARINLVLAQVAMPVDDVLAHWKRVAFLKQESFARRGWLLDVMFCVERIGRPVFTLAEVYRFEGWLAERYPENRNIRPKIRQQLQVLRDRGFLKFLGGGRYALKA